MYVCERGVRLVRNAIANYGPARVKRRLWDREYLAGQWNFNDDTADDPLYSYLTKYADSGSILDIGCGSGNTANELSSSSYSAYVGVDISQAALDKARGRTENNGRSGKVVFVCNDFIQYVPPQQFDVILFRHSLYMIPLNRIKDMLNRYARYLSETGVFVVSIRTSTNEGKEKRRPANMLHTIETSFAVVEKHDPGPRNGIVIVFRPPIPDQVPAASYTGHAISNHTAPAKKNGGDPLAR